MGVIERAVSGALANLSAMAFGAFVWLLSGVVGAKVGGFLGDLIFYIGSGFFILVCVAVMVNMLRGFLSAFFGKNSQGF